MLKLEHIYKKLGNFTLKDISFEVKEGEYFVILGPTGAGKTIILEIIAGIYNLDKGSIYINNRNLSNVPPEHRNIGFVYQDYLLFPHLSVRENILFSSKVKSMSKSSAEQALFSICEMLNIKHLLNRNISMLSGGEQQRIAFARAIITSPQILLLDEVSSALDPCTKEIFQQNLKKMHKNLNTTTIHVTHDFNEALYLADRIAVMNNGKILEIGSPEEIFEHPSSEFIAKFTGFSNLFKCKVSDRRAILSNDVKFVVKNNSVLNEAVAAVRGENVFLFLDPRTQNFENKFKGRIVEIINQGFIKKVIVDVGIELNSFVTEKCIEDLKLNPGKEVYVGIKDSDIQIL